MKNKLLFLLKILFSFLLIFLLLRGIEKEKMMLVFSRMKIGFFVAAASIYAASIFLNAFKWKTLLLKVSLFTLILVCFKAQFYSSVLPGQLFGEGYKVLALKDCETSNYEVAASVVFDKITGLVALLFFGLCGILNSQILLPYSLKIIFSVLLVLLIFACFFSNIKFFDDFFSAVIQFFLQAKSSVPKKLGGFLLNLYSSWKVFSKNYPSVIKNLVWAFINQFFGVFNFWLIAKFLNLQVPMAEFMWIYAVLSLLLLLPISFAGIGVRDVTLSGFLALFAVATEDAFMISLVMLGSQIVTACVGAALVLIGQVKDREFV